MSDMGEGWGFHPLGSFGGGEGSGPTPADQPAPRSPTAQPEHPVSPLTGFPSSQGQLKDGTGPSFDIQGLGRYVNRNNNRLQFNTPAVLQSVRKGIQMYDEAKYFRQAGFGAAIRHTLGMPQTPSHMNDYMRARHNQNVRGDKPNSVIGINHVAQGPRSHLETTVREEEPDWLS